MADTRLDNDVTKPSRTAPGDGPADTTDPTEMASTVTAPTPGPDAIKTGTVNAVLPIPQEAPGRRRAGRREEYEATRPDGSKVTVVHDLDTGQTGVKESTDTGSHRTAGN